MATKKTTAKAQPAATPAEVENPATNTEVADQVTEPEDHVEPVDPIVAAPDQTDPLVVLAMQYAAYYPNNSAFHITSDGQVFLSGDLSDAQNHQRTLGVGEVRTIKF